MSDGKLRNVVVRFRTGIEVVRTMDAFDITAFVSNLSRPHMWVWDGDVPPEEGGRGTFHKVEDILSIQVM